jgi:hypothetical protein
MAHYINPGKTGNQKIQPFNGIIDLALAVLYIETKVNEGCATTWFTTRIYIRREARFLVTFCRARQKVTRHSRKAAVGMF